MSDPWEEAMCEPVVVKKPSVTFAVVQPVTITPAKPAPPAAKATSAAPASTQQVGAAYAQSMAKLNAKIAYTTAMESGGVRDMRAEADAVRWSELAYQAKRAAKQAKMDAFNGIRRH